MQQLLNKMILFDCGFVKYIHHLRSFQLQYAIVAWNNRVEADTDI